MRSDSSQFRSLNEVISGVIIKLQNENLQTRNGQTTNPGELESGKDAKENRINEVTVPQKHQLAIARKTVKTNSAMLGVMGGMSKRKAHELLSVHGTAAEKTAAKNFLGVISAANTNNSIKEEVNHIDEVTASKKLAKLESARKAVKVNTTWTGHARQKAHEFLLRHGTAAEKSAAKNFLGVIADVKD